MTRVERSACSARSAAPSAAAFATSSRRDLGAEDVGHHLQDRGVGRGAAGRVDRRPPRRPSSASGAPAPSSAPRPPRARWRRVVLVEAAAPDPGHGTGGVISGSNHGSISAPPLPGADVSSARENAVPGQAVAIAHALACQRAVAEHRDAHEVAGRATRTRARCRRIDARLAHDAEDRVAGAERDATRPSRTRPRPTRLHGLSPDHTATLAAGSPCRELPVAATGARRCRRRRDGRQPPRRSGAVASSASGHHAPTRDPSGSCPTRRRDRPGRAGR